MPRGIIVFGANGSGKTTLGRELARVLNFKHIDHEEYAFNESKIPYTAPRSNDEVIELMLADIRKSNGFVISAVTGDFGDEIISMYDFAVFLAVPIELRMNRLEQREYERYGERIREGGDMHEQHLKFANFAATRSLLRIEQWVDTLLCPVQYIDGTLPIIENVAQIVGEYLHIKQFHKTNKG